MKTEVLRAVGIWVDSDRVSSLKNFSVMLYKGEVTGMLGLVGSGITVVADVLSGRKKMEKGCVYMGNTPVQIKGMWQAEKLGIYVVSEKNDFSGTSKAGRKFMSISTDGLCRFEISFRETIKQDTSVYGRIAYQAAASGISFQIMQF